jgi:RNA polymerase sigma-70 factor, ECF subfamily
VNTTEKTDEDLMQSFQEGDVEAFEILYRKFKVPIFSFLVRQFTDRENATELTQEVFARVVKSASTFRHRSKFSTWLYAIARNLAVDSARRGRLRNHPSIDQKTGDDGLTLGERIAGNEPEPDRASTSTRLRKDLLSAIAALPGDQREVFLLREYHGLPFAEIAKVVDAKIGTVKSRMRYALETLRNQLTEYTDYARTLP